MATFFEGALSASTGLAQQSLPSQCFDAHVPVMMVPLIERMIPPLHPHETCLRHFFLPSPPYGASGENGDAFLQCVIFTMCLGFASRGAVMILKVLG